MRKVTIFRRGKYDPREKKYEQIKVGEGMFHQWGVDYHEYKSGPVAFSAAIVELDDGSVTLWPAYLIQFHDLEPCAKSNEDAHGKRISELEEKIEKTQEQIAVNRKAIDCLHKQLSRCTSTNQRNPFRQRKPRNPPRRL